MVMMMNILTSAISASCSFYSYIPPLLLPSLFHYTLIVISIIGDFLNDMCDGSGIRQYINGKRAGDEYSGGWKANKRHGFGTYRSSKKEEYEGMILPCDDDVVVDDDDGDGDEYTNLCNLCFLLFLFIYSSLLYFTIPSL